jgi:hypothetical protein
MRGRQTATPPLIAQRSSAAGTSLSQEFSMILEDDPDERIHCGVGIHNVIN